MLTFCLSSLDRVSYFCLASAIAFLEERDTLPIEEMASVVSFTWLPSQAAVPASKASPIMLANRRCSGASLLLLSQLGW